MYYYYYYQPPEGTEKEGRVPSPSWKTKNSETETNDSRRPPGARIFFPERSDSDRGPTFVLRVKPLGGLWDQAAKALRV